MGCASSGNRKSGQSGTYKIAVTDDEPDSHKWLGIRPRTVEDPMNRKLFHGAKAESFTYFDVLGRGMSGEVILVTYKKNDLYYVLKRIPKRSVLQKKSLEGIKNELFVAKKVHHPLVCHCFTYFHDRAYIYLVFEYAPGGELFSRMSKAGKFSEEVAKFYTSEIAEALRFMHEGSVLYRDLKPENIMLGADGHVQLVDFGLARLVEDERGGRVRARTFSGRGGTAMYMAPEVACAQPAPGRPSEALPAPRLTPALDWWALGCLLYEMLTGKPPFGDSSSRTKFEILNSISAGRVSYPARLSASARRLLQGLLESDVEKRFGWEQLQRSEWMQDMDWSAVANKRLVPPWIPSLKGVGDRSCFQSSWGAPEEEKEPLSAEELGYFKGL